MHKCHESLHKGMSLLVAITHRSLEPKQAQAAPYTQEVVVVVVVVMAVLMVVIIVKAHNLQMQQHHQMIPKKKSMR